MKRSQAGLASLMLLAFSAGCAKHWESRPLSSALDLQEFPRVRITRADRPEVVLEDPWMTGDSIGGRTLGERQCHRSFDGSREVCARPTISLAIPMESIEGIDVWAVDEVWTAIGWIVVPFGIVSFVILVDGCSDPQTWIC